MIDQMYYLIGDQKPIACLGSISSRKIDSIDTYTNWFGSAESGEMEVEDTAIGLIQFTNGITGFVHVSWSDDVDGDFVKIHLKCSEGSLTLHTLFGFSNQVLYKEPHLIWTPKGQPSKYIPLPRPSDRLIHFKRQAAYFIQCIRERNPVDPSVYAGERVVDLIERLYRSAELGKVIT